MAARHNKNNKVVHVFEFCCSPSDCVNYTQCTKVFGTQERNALKQTAFNNAIKCFIYKKTTTKKKRASNSDKRNKVNIFLSLNMHRRSQVQDFSW